MWSRGDDVGQICALIQKPLCCKVLICHVFGISRCHSHRQPCRGRQRSKRHWGCHSLRQDQENRWLQKGDARTLMQPLSAPEKLRGAAATSPCRAGLWLGPAAAPLPWAPAWGQWTCRAALKSPIPMAVCSVQLYLHRLVGGEQMHLKPLAQNRGDCKLWVTKGVTKTFRWVFFFPFCVRKSCGDVAFSLFLERCCRKQESK